MEIKNIKGGARTTVVGSSVILGLIIASLIVDYAPDTKTGAILTEYSYVIGTAVSLKLIAAFGLIFKGKK